MSVHHKIERAKKHLDELKETIATYFKSNPYKIISEKNSDGDLIYRLSIVNHLPSDKWACIVGDVLHNLRAALDLRIAELIILNGNTVERENSFPIMENKEKFDKFHEKKLKGVSKVNIQKIVNLKPYPPDNLLLWELHDVDIADKHRHLVIAGGRYDGVSVSMWEHLASLGGPLASSLKQMIKEKKTPDVFVRPADTMFPLKDGDIVFIVKAQAGEILLDVPKFKFNIAYAKSLTDKGELLIPKLESLIKTTEDALAILK